MTGTITTRMTDGVCTITLEHEGKRNAIDYAMMERLTEVFEDFERAEDEPIVILRGAGDVAFSAGFDLTAARRDDFEDWDGMIEAIAGHDSPTIAMLNGLAYGGGLHVAAACDIRIARDDAEFAIPEARLGIVYAPDALERLVHLLGPADTKALVFSGTPIGADRARSIGLVNQVVERSTIESFTADLAAQIGGNSSFAVRSMKEIIDALAEAGPLAGADRERAQALRRAAFERDDAREGRAAFLADRDPDFAGQ